jgi:hypothetical protein
VFTADCASDLSTAYSYRKETTDEELSSQIIVYLNPAGKVVFIQLSIHAATRVHLVDALGNTLSTSSFTGSGQKHELHFNGVSAGVYLLCLEVGNRIIIKKMMVG